MKEKESVEVIIRDLDSNPKCLHGPTILFSTKNQKYFSCAFNRSTTECFYMKFEHFEKNQAEILAASRKDNIQSTSKNEKEIDLRNVSVNKRYFCTTCNNFAIDFAASHKYHNIRHITDDILKEPSLFLPQLNNDKVNAQYFFDDSTLDFINSIFDQLELSSIICIGAPRLHDFLRTKKAKKSLLLDIDERFQPFYPNEFCRYNMFNNFFFNGSKDEEKLIKFLSSDHIDEHSHHCLFTDPPFAARTELLSQTIKTISSLYYKLAKKLLPIFWIFPYFNEPHVVKVMPEMEMLDFQVTYMNHRAFNSEYKGRKEGSVVRIFTNVAQNLITYPADLISYRFCKSCKRFVHRNNVHCNICQVCPSKNGSTYKHCNLCIKCVKPNYIHCQNCDRCTQKLEHDCNEFQKHQECWMCYNKGHVEKFCQFLKGIKRKVKRGRCILCNQMHNLKNCPQKSQLLNKI